MHELSLCQAIAQAVVQHAEGRPVTRVIVRIGHFRQVVPDALAFSWEVLNVGTELADCELEIEHVAATAECAACGATTTLDHPVLVCGSCGGSDVTLLTGEEFLVVSLELAEV